MIPFIAGAKALSLSTKIAAATMLAAALFSAGLYVGHKWGVSSCYEATIEAQRHTIETGVKQAVVSDKTVTEYVDRVQIVQGKSREIIKEVKVYVTEKNDVQCMVNTGFVRMWNDANSSSISASSGNSDETASTVILSEVATQHAKEALICNETEQQLLSLQEWVREQSSIR